MALTPGHFITEKSTMPPGGGPADDSALLEWASSFAERVNTRWLDLHSVPGGELPSRELMTPWQLVYHLFKSLVGWEWPEGTGPSRAHRIRFVAVQYRLRRDEVAGLARSYARHLYDEATRDGSGPRDD